MACDGGKGMMGSMQIDKEKELLQQQPHQHQPQLPGAAAPTPWPSPQAPLPPQQSVEAQQLPLLSPPEEVGRDEHEKVMVSKNMVVEIGGVMACDGGKGMMESMQMDKEKELLQQQPQQQQPQLPGAAAPDPWPLPMSSEHERQQSNWKREALALVGPSASSGVGGTRRLLGALPVRGEHVYAKRGELLRASRSERHVLLSSASAVVPKYAL